jgi:hypothetical protein
MPRPRPRAAGDCRRGQLRRCHSRRCPNRRPCSSAPFLNSNLSQPLSFGETRARPAGAARRTRPSPTASARSGCSSWPPALDRVLSICPSNAVPFRASRVRTPSTAPASSSTSFAYIWRAGAVGRRRLRLEQRDGGACVWSAGAAGIF